MKNYVTFIKKLGHKYVKLFQIYEIYAIFMYTVYSKTMYENLVFNCSCMSNLCKTMSHM